MGNVIVTSFIVLTALAGYALRSLTLSGALAALVVGIAVFHGFGLSGIVLLGIFFASSSAWSKYKSSMKVEIEERLAKGARRDWQQVLANGGLAGLVSVLYSVWPNNIYFMGFLVSLASANSDTWASEIGSLSKKKPFSVRSFTRVERGTSGAVSLLGTLSALAGSLLMAVSSVIFLNLPFEKAVFVFVFGFLGNLLDTLLGAFFQSVYFCHTCCIETEKKFHCGKVTGKLRGLTILDNDVVNFLSGLLAVCLTIPFL
ncbi:MAG: DUF92 domain-containing protein [Bacillota bacterium]|nr:DUF92 domain-containing protein [Bacillota bacterium]